MRRRMEVGLWWQRHARARPQQQGKRNTKCTMDARACSADANASLHIARYARFEGIALACIRLYAGNKMDSVCTIVTWRKSYAGNQSDPYRRKLISVVLD